MSGYNQIAMIGNVGSEIRSFGDGENAGCSFSVACNNPKKSPEGEWVDADPTWFRVSAYGKLGERAKTLTKGSKVYVVGRLDTREYEKDGQKHVSLEVKAQTIINLTPKTATDDGKAPF